MMKIDPCQIKTVSTPAMDHRAVKDCTIELHDGRAFKAKGLGLDVLHAIENGDAVELVDGELLYTVKK